MPIITSNLVDVHLFDARSQALSLCEAHQKEIAQDIFSDVDALVRTPLFQRHFKAFLPAPGQEVQVNISITSSGIVVTKADGTSNTVDFSSSNETPEENVQILEKVNKVYRQHIEESPHYQQLATLSEQLSEDSARGSTHFPRRIKESFMELPEEIRNEIYYHTWLILPATFPDYFPVGQRVFEGTDSDLPMQNLCRSHAIRQLMLQSLSNDFEEERFLRLPKEDQDLVRTQFNHIHEWKIACQRALLSRQHDYHAHDTQEMISVMEGVMKDSRPERPAD